MEKDIKQMLDEEIRDEITNLNALEPGTEEHSKAADTVAKLYKLKVEDDKIDKETSEQVKNRYLKYGLEAAGIIVPLIFYGIWMNKGFKFEETGTFTSSTFRGLFNRFRPTK